MAQKLHQITVQGLEELKNELDHIIKVDLEQNKIAIQDARALGDLSENSEYSSAKDIQTKLNARVAEIQEIIKYHEIIAEEWYTVRYDGQKEDREFQLVGVLETDPLLNKVSKESPLGKAVAGRRPGEVVTYTSGAGKKISITIVKRGK